MGGKQGGRSVSAFDREYVSAKEAIDLLRLQKHDFLNYIQIISGYLQLGNVEKATAYVQKATEEIDRSSSITRIANPALGINLLLHVYKVYQRSGIAINLYTGTMLEFLDYDERTTQFLDRVFAAIEEVYDTGQCQQRVRIIFREKRETDDHYWLQISVEPFEADAFSSLKERVEAAGAELGFGTFVEDLKEEECSRLQVCMAKSSRSG